MDRIEDILERIKRSEAAGAQDPAAVLELWDLNTALRDRLAAGINPLDELAKRHGTDKSSDFHGFTRHYFHHFAPIRLAVRKILEIGIFHGASLKMWAEFFPHAKIYGLDNDPNCFQEQSDRIRTFLGLQEDKDFLSGLVQQIGSDLDIIIDDGGHRRHEQIASFEILFPALRPGGIYVFEDLHSSYWDFCGGGYKKPGTAIEVLKDLIDQMNLFGRVDCGDPERAIKALEEKFPEHKLGYFEKSLAAIHIYKSLAFLVKR